jgi:16S rRNA (adenine1518-N6/adenine1519-N6)-dimethyltransferase
LKAKKSFGQHFLKEESIAERIAQSLSRLEEYENILEVGPGMGMLTKYLFEHKNHQLKVVEADEDMVNYLNANYPQLKDHIISLDFLKLNMNEVFDGKPFGLIGNYPYNISSQILMKAVECRDLVPEVVGMFQKEVADRVVAKEGSKTYGVISVLIQAYYEAEYLFTVKAGSFNPPPKVKSAVIALKRKKDYLSLGCDDRLFRTVVKASFNMRRKMLRNSMKPFLPKMLMEDDPFFQQRPEQLSLQDFIFLTNLVTKHKID